MYGIVGITALLLVGCSNAAEQDQEAASTAAVESDAEALQVSGVIHAKGDNALYMSDDFCVVNHPALAEVMAGIDGAQVLVLDAEGSTAAVAEFESQYSEDECVWFFNADVDGSSDFYSAEFLEVETPVVPAADAEDGVLMLDPATPLQEQAESSTSPVDSFPGN